MNKIKRISYFFRIIFQVAFALLMLIEAIAWIGLPAPVLMFMRGFHISVSFIPKTYQAHIMHTLTASGKFFIFLINLTPTILEFLLIYFLIKLFKLYEKGEIFSINNVKYIRNAGYALLLNQLISPICEFFFGLVITANNPSGHRFASVTFDQSSFGLVLTALMVILISWIMTEACKLNEEQQLTI